MKVRSGAIASPYKLIVYGTEGIGKSTFASQTERAVFLELEPRTDHLEIDRLGDDRPQTFDEAMKLIGQVAKDEHDYRTLVIDTIDSLSRMIEDHLCRLHGWPAIDQGPEAGYGKGDNAAKSEMRKFLKTLERSIWTARKMNVVLLGHSEVKKTTPPEGESYDRYELRLKPKMAQDVREWADAIFFAEFEVATAKSKDDKKIRGFMTGNRVMHTERRAAFDAKNSWGLPPTMPFDFAAFDAARKVGASFEELETELVAMEADRQQRLREWIASQPNKTVAASAVLRRIREEKAA